MSRASKVPTTPTLPDEVTRFVADCSVEELALILVRRLQKTNGRLSEKTRMRLEFHLIDKHQ